MTSVKTIVSKIVRDLNLGYQEIPFQDFVEWIAEGLSHVGAYAQFTPKETIVPIKDYVGMMPCDFHQLIEIKMGCSLDSNYSRYDVVSDGLDALGLREEDRPPLSPSAFLMLQLAMYDQHNPIESKSFYNKLRNNESFINKYSMNQSIGMNDYRFLKESNSISTTFRDGFVTVSYLAFPVDCDGFPLVPDTSSFKDAMFWKVAYHLCMRGHEFQAQEMRSLVFCKQQWNFYCKQARGEANAPNLEQLDQYSKIWTSLIPYYFEFDNDFKNTGQWKR
jgi:hypothetical protein